MTVALSVRIVVLTLLGLLAFAASASADHERFIVGTMRNVDRSAEIITSTSGACVPSHDRETLECYFTTFGLWKSTKETQLRKNFAEIVQQLDKDPMKQVRDMKKSFCDDKEMTQPDPLRLKYDVSAKKFLSSVTAFCDRPSRESALNLFRTMNEIEGRKCNCVVSDWRATLVRQAADRWIENSGPSGLCGVIKVFTLVPHDPKKMKEPTGPVLWTLHEKTVTTHSADDKVCGKGLFKIEEGATTVSWDAPSKSIDCGDIEFTSALEGMSDPRGPKGK
jgi:hypothetical protein